MEFRNSTISRDLLIHRPPIPFPAKFSSVTLKNTNAGSALIPSSIKFPLHSASSFNRPLYLSSRFQISSQFGRATNRQNYFRKKLTQLQQVSDIWDFSKSPLENVDTNSCDLKTSSSSEKIADLDANSEVISNAGAILESNSPGNSVLSNNLEGWDEKYKDPEFWGKGTEAIFTVFRQYNGEVKRVVLNENELLRRSGVNPVLYKEGFVKGLGQVNSKILFASMFAREIEKGKVVFTGNSSVVKLISSTMDPSITIIHNTKKGIIVSSSSSSSSTITVELLVIIFGFWVIKKVFNLWSNYRQEKPEKEILRRNQDILKRKKEILTRNIENRMRGRVEIDQDSERSYLLSVESPHLTISKGTLT